MVARHLKHFVVVAEQENLHRAAELLNVAQSALSRRIHDLEREIGFPLFDRGKRGIRLNDAGKVFYRSARQILESLERAQRDVEKVAAGRMGTIHLGFNESALRHHNAVRALQNCQSCSPDVEFILHHYISGKQVDMIKAGSLDAGLVYNFFKDDPDIAALTMFEDGMLLAINEKHPLASKPSLRLHDLRNEPMIWASRKQAPFMFDRMIAAFQSKGLSPSVKMEIPYSHLTLNVVSAGMGMGFVSETDRGNEPPGVRLVPVEDFSVRTPVDLVWARSNASPILARFVESMAAYAVGSAPRTHAPKGNPDPA